MRTDRAFFPLEREDSNLPGPYSFQLKSVAGF